MEDQPTKLFVGQVPSVCTEDILRPVFCPYGTIHEISIMRDKYGKSKGCAWVTYATKAEAEEAIQDLHDKHCIPPQTNPLQVRVAGSPPMNQSGPRGGTGHHPQHNNHNRVPPLPGGNQSGGHPMNAMPVAPQYGRQPPYFAAPQFQPMAGFGAGMPAHGMIMQPQPQQMMQPQPRGMYGGNSRGYQHGGPQRGGRPQRVMSKGGRKLFVGQLSPDIKEAELRNTMEEYGSVDEVVMLRDGAAFVIFADKEDAFRAVEDLRAKGTFNVRHADGEGEEDESKLFIGMLPFEATEEDLERVFGQYGQTSEVVVLRQNNRSRGAAFVRYSDKESAFTAVRELHGRTVFPGSTNPLVVQIASSAKRSKYPDRQDNGYGMGGGRGRGRGGRGAGAMGGMNADWDVSDHSGVIGGGMRSAGAPYFGGDTMSTPSTMTKPPNGPKGANLFVRNLPMEMTEPELMTLFAQYGTVVSSTIYRDRTTGASKGFGFVSYDTPDAADAAVASLNGTTVRGHILQVQLKNTDQHGEQQ